MSNQNPKTKAEEVILSIGQTVESFISNIKSVKVNSASTADKATTADAISGVKMYASSVVRKGTGTNKVTVPKPSGVNKFIGVLAQNSNALASQNVVTSTHYRDDDIEVFFANSFSNNVQISYIILYQ